MGMVSPGLEFERTFKKGRGKILCKGGKGAL